MSVQPIIQALEKLIKLHEGLLDTARQKTDIIKEGSAGKLQSLLITEHKYIQALEQAEVNRQRAVEAWLADGVITLDHATITAILETLSDGEEKMALENTTARLTNMITQLKQQEELNQALIQQSMQFVELSLDMMNPSMRNMNYGNKQTGSSVQSVFDSKA